MLEVYRNRKKAWPLFPNVRKLELNGNWQLGKIRGSLCSDPTMSEHADMDQLCPSSAPSIPVPRQGRQSLRIPAYRYKAISSSENMRSVVIKIISVSERL
jgi:hypothetical protein